MVAKNEIVRVKYSKSCGLEPAAVIGPAFNDYSAKQDVLPKTSSVTLQLPRRSYSKIFKKLSTNQNFDFSEDHQFLCQNANRKHKQLMFQKVSKILFQNVFEELLRLPKMCKPASILIFQ